MIHELRLFCEDNNQAPPAPLRAVRAHELLSYWSASEPALMLEMEAVELRAPSGRVCYLQRVLDDLRYLVLLENRVDFERGSVPDLLTALELARIWLAGGELKELPETRRPVV